MSEHVVDLTDHRRRRDPSAFVRGPAPQVVTREAFVRGLTRCRDALERARAGGLVITLGDAHDEAVTP